MSWPLRQIDLLYYSQYPHNFSDGLVEIDDALIPGSSYIIANGVDHGDTTMKIGTDFDRQSFMRLILALIDHEAGAIF